MNSYIVALTRNIGRGKDLINHFENRGINVVFEDRLMFPKTIVVSTTHPIKYLQRLTYVANVVEAVKM